MPLNIISQTNMLLLLLLLAPFFKESKHILIDCIASLMRKSLLGCRECLLWVLPIFW
jgi:hypothetical protein